MNEENKSQQAEPVKENFDEKKPDNEKPGEASSAKTEPAKDEKPKKEKQKKGNRSFFEKYLKNWVMLCVLIAFLIELFIETLARQSAVGGIIFLAQHPLVFLYNALLIFAVLSVSMLFKRRTFALILFSMVWIVLGIVNGIILSNRMTPFTTHDIMELKDGLSIMTNYMSTVQIVELFGGVVLLVLLIIVLFRKAPKNKNKTNFRFVIPGLLLIGMITAGATGLAVKAGVIDTYFPNLAYGYRDNGFPYCFAATWLDKGVSRPDPYTKDSIRGIYTKKELNTTVGYTHNDGDEDHPNIIFVQLESFIDPAIANDIKLDQDAIPYYNKLRKEYSSGKIQVPSVGAGTANTEFESMTGMSVKFFGPGEYPYKTVLTKKSCESIPYDLINIGYSTHCIHNHRGAFYNRNISLANLGFQTFTSLEYMSSVSKTPKNWAKDNVLTEQVFDALKSTPGEDYIYTISVQGHGKYPTEEMIKKPVVKVTEAPTDELKWQWEYYANQVHEMDEWVKDFLAELKNYKEKTVVVMYGDHLPAIDNLTEDNIAKDRNVYQTDYVIWSNFDMPVVKKDLYCYQIGSELLGRLGIHNGTIVTHHQKHKHSKTYLSDLEALQYDILYGERYIYNNNGEMPFAGLDMKMGVKKIKIDKVVKIGDKYYLKGQNFTEYSKINLNGEILDTVYLGPTILGLNEEVDPEDVKNMKVSQVEKNQEILSTSE